MNRQRLSAGTLFFVLGGLAALTPWVGPPLALAIGLIVGLTCTHPYQGSAKGITRYLLQASVVALGFRMDLHQVIEAGRAGFLYTAGGIAFALLFGAALGRLLKVRSTAAFLISTGTAICGGSAIAAVAPIAEATSEEMSISLGTVFVLNSIALLTFPAIGLALGLSQKQFGLWSALAIHDTSSVVGATARYGSVALAVGTSVKLARALWIVPVSVATAAFKGSRAKIQWPWFILLFTLAAVANTYAPGGAGAFRFLAAAGQIGLTLTLYLIGSSLSRATLKELGVGPLLQGTVLWMVVAGLSLALIRAGVVHLP